MTLVILLVLELALTVYVISRLRRYRAAPSPALRAAILTAISLLAAVLAVTEPVEVVLRGPNGVTVWIPTLLKHLGLLGCGIGVLLLGLAQRGIQRSFVEVAVWTWFAVSCFTVLTLHVVSGGGGTVTSVEYVEWSHTQPLLIIAMTVAYIGGLIASLGLLIVVWPLRLSSPAGRGMAMMSVGALGAAGWCVARAKYVRQAVFSQASPTVGDFVVTEVMSVVAVIWLTAGLVWPLLEAASVAWWRWRQFRSYRKRLIGLVPQVHRTSDRRLGLAEWVHDRALELMDAYHQSTRDNGPIPGFPAPPHHVSPSEITAVAARLGREYSRSQQTQKEFRR